MDSQISEFLAKHGTAGKTYNFAFDHSSSFEEIIYGELDAEGSTSSRAKSCALLVQIPEVHGTIISVEGMVPETE